jgi:hypothetical protein
MKTEHFYIRKETWSRIGYVSRKLTHVGAGYEYARSDCESGQT